MITQLPLEYFRASHKVEAFWRKKFFFFQNNRLVMITSKQYDRKRMNALNESMISIHNLKPSFCFCHLYCFDIYPQFPFCFPLQPALLKFSCLFILLLICTMRTS